MLRDLKVVPYLITRGELMSLWRISTYRRAKIGLFGSSNTSIIDQDMSHSTMINFEEFLHLISWYLIHFKYVHLNLSHILQGSRGIIL